MIYKAEEKQVFFSLYCVSQFDKMDTLQLFDYWGIFMHMQLLLDLVR